MALSFIAGQSQLVAFCVTPELWVEGPQPTAFLSSNRGDCFLPFSPVGAAFLSKVTVQYVLQFCFHISIPLYPRQRD